MGIVPSDDVDRFRFLVDIGPGVMACIYFVIFEIFVLALVDALLARFVCTQYYKLIYRGHPVRVHSVDIPGVTTNLLDSLLITPNIIAILCKLLILGLIFYIDYDIDTVQWQPETLEKRSGMFVFNGSDTHWRIWEPVMDENGIQIYKTKRPPVEIRWDDVRKCRITNAIINTVTFYNIALNQEGNTSLTEQVVDNVTAGNEIGFDDNSIVCMSPKHVLEPKVMAKVSGCSWLRSQPNCTLTDKRRHTGEIAFPAKVTKAMYEITGGVVTLPFFRLKSEDVAKIWTEYAGANVTCAYLPIGPEGKQEKRQHCIVVAWNSTLNGTLVERWQYDYGRKQVYRRYPGPVFEGQLDIGEDRMLVLLQYPKQELNWEYYSSVVVADMATFSEIALNITVLSVEQNMTYLSVWSIGVGGVVFVVVLIVRISFYFTIDRDDRPRFNCIDGLSSIVREEHEATGHSQSEGKGTMLGVSQNDEETRHLGPMRLLGELDATVSPFSVIPQNVTRRTHRPEPVFAFNG